MFLAKYITRKIIFKQLHRSFDDSAKHSTMQTLLLCKIFGNIQLFYFFTHTLQIMHLSQHYLCETHTQTMSV